MFITVHAATGAVIGKLTDSLWLAFSLGFILHLILDIIPHGDEDLKYWSWFKNHLHRNLVLGALDFIGVLIMLGIWIANTDSDKIIVMLVAIAGSIVPDVLWGFYELTGTPVLKWYKDAHDKIHDIIKFKISVLQGFLLQVPLLLILTWIIICF